MKKALKTSLQVAIICALVVMLTMGINFILGVSITIGYYIFMWLGFSILSFMWSFGTCFLQSKFFRKLINKNNIINKSIKTNKHINNVRKINYNSQTYNIRKRKIS